MPDNKTTSSSSSSSSSSSNTSNSGSCVEVIRNTSLNEQHSACPKFCILFDKETLKMEDMYMDEAKQMINGFIDLAFRRLETSMSDREKSFESLKQLRMSREHTIHKEDTYAVENIEWLTIDEFTVEKGEQKIHEFIKTWQFENSWLYCVDFLSEEEHEFDKRYMYRVRWSIPTRRKPIPRATASVYFTYVVSKIRPRSNPVEVFYIFETNRLIHKPGLSRFREMWLKDIIESKVKLINRVTF
ncbi:A-kinase anchor protein 14 [Plakobranchus ocellatus]|uniref:A-kinase anchor protein 14 n=1 Tax=Plakobranchus ocellatus TaxID=259542 RepID=A0AAV3Y8Z0_9GAST|nr:A-kinase anchor protein 14 [Plakobranchus ocellatus]